MEYRKIITQYADAIQYNGENSLEIKEFITSHLEGEGNEVAFDEKEYNIKFMRDGNEIIVNKKGILLRIFIQKKGAYQVHHLIDSEYLKAGKNTFSVITAEKFEEDWEATEDKTVA